MLIEHVYLGFLKTGVLLYGSYFMFSSASTKLAYHPSETPRLDATLIKLHQHMTQRVSSLQIHIPACQVLSLSSSTLSQEEW